MTGKSVAMNPDRESNGKDVKYLSDYVKSALPVDSKVTHVH